MKTAIFQGRDDEARARPDDARVIRGGRGFEMAKGSAANGIEMIGPSVIPN
ncbi:MAG: hypothetical protein ACE14P_12235 [Methanotrichaceae archaeon]